VRGNDAKAETPGTLAEASTATQANIDDDEK
jgi:hypothetical protein